MIPRAKAPIPTAWAVARIGATSAVQAIAWFSSPEAAASAVVAGTAVFSAEMVNGAPYFIRNAEDEIPPIGFSRYRRR